MESLDHAAYSKTYNVDFQIPDSAATATALLSGHKTKFFTLGTAGNVVYEDLESLRKELKMNFFWLEKQILKDNITYIIL